MQEERRIRDRIRVSFPAFLFDGKSNPVTATVTDISSSGLCVNAPEWEVSLRSGVRSFFEAAFFAPGVPGPIIIRCDGIWTRSSDETLEVGCSFKGGDPGSQFALQQYLVSRVREASISA